MEIVGTNELLIRLNKLGFKADRHTMTRDIDVLNSQGYEVMPTHVDLGSNYGLFLESTALAEQILTLDRSRFGECIGTVDDMKMLEVDRALRVSLALDYDDD